MRLTAEGIYRFTWQEHVQCFVIWFGLCIGIGWLFYDDLRVGILGVVTYFVFYKISYQYKVDVCKRQLRMEFKDAMLSIYSSLSAGTTLDESVKRAMADMQRGTKEGSRITQELTLVCQKMESNVPVGQCLEEMALRCQSIEMANFSQVLSIGKRQGGNMARLVQDSVGKIQRRIEMVYEIEGIIGAKRNEFLFMCAIPVGIIVYMRMTSPDFMAVLYGNIRGVLCMTICLIMYIAAIYLGMRILRLDQN